jgi:O-antigen/teichoic acid export membrane protein
MAKPDALTSTLARYLSSKLFSQFIGAVLGFLRPKLLSPELFGIWTLLKLIPQYAKFSDIGIRTAFRVFYPWHQARGDKDRAEALVSGGILGALLIDSLLAAAISTIALVGDWDVTMRFGLLAMAVVVIFQGLHHSLFGALKASHRFDIISRANYIESSTLLLTTLILLPTLGIYGLLLSLLSSELAVVIFVSFRTELAVRWSRNILTMMAAMIRQGWPIMSLELAMVLVVTTDRFVVSFMLDTTALGYYGVALMIVNFLRNVPGTAREVLEPRLMADLANTDRSELMSDHVLKPVLNAAFLMPLLIGPVALAAPLAIDWLLPAYQPAGTPTQILACGVYFLALSVILRSAIVAIGRQRQAALLMPLIVLANILIAWLGITLGYGLSGVAAASGFAFMLLYLTLRRLLRSELAATTATDRKELIWVWPLFILTCLLIWGLPRIISDMGLIGTSIRILTFIGILFIVNWIAGHRLKLLSPLPFSVIGSHLGAIRLRRKR